MLFTIRTKRTNPFHEVYSSDPCNSLDDALAQWLYRRKAGRAPFTRRQELHIAISIGMAMTWPGNLKEVDAFGDTIEVIVK